MKEQLFCSKCGKLNWSRWGETCECKEPDYRFESYDDYLAHEKEKRSAKDRDWQKDMELVEKFKYSQTLCNGIQPTFHGMISMPEPVEIALEYWLQQYAAEKARAEKAERKEQKLKEAMEHCIKEIPLWESKVIACVMLSDYMKNILSILYPKEEAK